MINVYFISGLGADRRAFDKISLDNDLSMHFIDWLEPINKETLAQYALRMAESIDTSKTFVLVGLSFGGIVAIEIAKLLNADKVVLISSISNCHQLPAYYKLLGKIGIHRSFLMSLLKHRSSVLHWFFGTKSNKLKAYLDEMIAKTSINYLRWSLNQIVGWKQSIKPERTFHIHGGNDKLFPIQYIQADSVIDKAGHFMVITHAREVSNFINQAIKGKLH